jgi:hypothetical protein
LTCTVFAVDPLGVIVTVAVVAAVGSVTPDLNATDTIAVPDPDAGVTCSHVWFVVTLQLTGAPAAWLMMICCAVVFAAPLAARLSDDGDTVIDVLPLCETVTALPATVIVAERVAPVVFAVTLNEIDPLPVRPVPFEIVSHEAESVADHPHPLAVVTVTDVFVPAADDMDTLAGLTVNEQLDADWLTVNVLPPAMIVPVRDDEPAFASTLKPTLPLPVPLAPLVMLIQFTVLDADHAHEAVVVTAMVPLPPPAAMVWLVGEMV